MGYAIEITINKTTHQLLEFSEEKLEVSVGRDAESIRIRALTSGKIIFYDASYHTLWALKIQGDTSVLATMYWEDEGIRKIVYDGSLLLLGSWYEEAHRCELDLVGTDKYTKLLQNLNNEIGFEHDEMIHNQFQFKFRTKTMCRPLNDDIIPWDLDDAFWHSVGWSDPSDPLPWSPDRCYSAAEHYTQSSDRSRYVGDRDKSFTTYKGAYYACKYDHANVEPGTPDGEYYWRIMYHHLTTVGQRYANMPMDNTVWYSVDNKWVRGTSDPTPYFVSMYYGCTNAYKLLKSVLHKIDTTILIDKATYFKSLAAFSPEIDELMLMMDAEFPQLTRSEMHDGAEESIGDCAKRLSITPKQLFSVYSLFNVDWELTDTNHFRFVHPSERGITISSNEHNDVTTLYGKNFSQELFADAASRSVLSEKVSLDNKEAYYAEFKPHKLTYATPFDAEEAISIELNTDISSYARNGSSSGIVLLAQNADGRLINKSSSDFQNPNEGAVHNYALSLTVLFPRYWFWDRPHSSGVLTIEEFEDNLPKDVALIKRPNRETTISIPLISPHDINLNELLKTDYGYLVCSKVSVSLGSAIAKIEGAKQ